MLDCFSLQGRLFCCAGEQEATHVGEQAGHRPSKETAAKSKPPAAPLWNVKKWGTFVDRILRETNIRKHKEGASIGVQQKEVLTGRV